MPDVPGALLLATALALLNLAVIKAPDWGWGSPRVVGGLALTVILGALFVRSTSRHRAPVVDPALVRIPAFRVASVATVLAGAGFYAYLLTNILWLQYVWGYGVLRAGLALVPGAVVAAVVAARLGPLAERIGYRVLVVPGALVWAGAYLWYHQQVGTTPAFWGEWLPGQVLSGIGVGATLPLLASAALAAVPGGRYATASALISSVRQLGGVLGISFLVLIVGTPSSATIVGALHDGWLLSIVAFAATALLSLLLVRPRADETVSDEQSVAPMVLPVETPPEPDGADLPDVGLGSIPLLEGLPEHVLSELAAASRTIALPAGEWLFEQGDQAGSAYVVASGRLQIMRDDVVVRELSPGAVVGELALLTGEPRSAGARAHRDATLLELPRSAFDAVLDADPAATRTLLVQMAQQLRTSHVNGERPESLVPRVVAVVGVHEGSAAADVAAVLLARLAPHLRAADPGRTDAAGLARAERELDRVVLVADGAPGGTSSADSEWRDFCVRQADLVVLVARSDATPPATGVPGLAARPEVLLVGPRPPAERLVSWTTSTDARQVTVADGDLAVGLRPLADRIATRSLGLVLAGGGARAFAHLGVLLELEQAGYRVDRLAGTSVGAIVAGQYAVGRDAAEVEEICYLEFVRRKPFSDWTLPRHSLARGARTRAGLKRTLGADAVLDGLPRQLHVVSTDLLSRTRQVHSSGNLAEAVAASCRLPILFPPMPTEDGRLLVDGGVLDNLPVDLLVDRHEGPVVAVNISMGGGSGRTRTGPPRVPALGDTLFRTMMIGAGGAVQAAHERGAVVVTPASMGVGLLEFHQFDVMVQSGREAARAMIDQGLLSGAADRSGGGAEAVRDAKIDGEGVVVS
jgi:predicted acylesterase/phospholipase RssA/CRP-like cAMP-binding protein